MSSISEIYLTRCPVGNATEIAVQKGWLAQDLKKLGVSLRLLRDLPIKKWPAHFTHGVSPLFRDGGNIPPIWARSNGADTKVIGLNFNERRGGIIVKKDAPFETVGDLKRKKFALPVHKLALIDFPRARSLKGITSALAYYGLEQGDIKLVELVISDPLLASSRQEAQWESVFLRRSGKPAYAEEVNALLEGKVDAIYADGARGERLVIDGTGKRIFDFEEHRHSDWVNIERPSIITVSGEFARENPEIVVAFLKSVIKAARWAKDNVDEVIAIYAKGSWLDDREAERGARPTHFQAHLTPEFSADAVKALETEKNFLLNSEFIDNDFSIAGWIDDSFLTTALKELAEEENGKVS